MITIFQKEINRLENQLNTIWLALVNKHGANFEQCLRAVYHAAPNIPAKRAQSWLMMWAITAQTPDKTFPYTIEEKERWHDKQWQPTLAYLCETLDLFIPMFSTQFYQDYTYVRELQDSPTTVLGGLWNVSPKRSNAAIKPLKANSINC